MTENTTPLNLPFFKINRFAFGEEFSGEVVSEENFVSGFVLDMDNITEDISSPKLEELKLEYENIFSSTYVMLQLLGYKLEETRIYYAETGSDIVILHDTMQVVTAPHGGHSHRITVSPISGCNVPLTFTETLEQSYFSSLLSHHRYSTDNLQIISDGDLLHINFVFLSNESRFKEFENFDEILKATHSLIYYLLLFKITSRIAVSYLDETLVGSALEFLGGLAQEYYYGNDASQADLALAPHNHSGLLWLMNPAYWEIDESYAEGFGLLIEEAGKVWERGFLASGARNDTISAVESFIDFANDPFGSATELALGVDLSPTNDTPAEIAKMAVGMLALSYQSIERTDLLSSGWLGIRFAQREKRARFVSAVRTAIETSGAVLPDTIVWNMDQFSYFELIETLINFGVINVSLPNFTPLEIEDTRCPYYFYYKYAEGQDATDENITGIDFHLYDFLIEVRQKQRLYDSENETFLPIQDCMTWEYKEPTEGRLATLILVAAPGVLITSLEGLPTTCNVLIYRVQDPAYVSEWYGPIDLPLLVQQQFSSSEVVRLDGEGHPFNIDDPILKTDTAQSKILHSAEEMHFMPPGMQMKAAQISDEMKTALDLEGAENIRSDQFPAFLIKPKFDSQGHMIGVNISAPATPGIVGEQSEPYFLDVDITVDPHASNQRFGFYIDKIHMNWFYAEQVRKSGAPMWMPEYGWRKEDIEEYERTGFEMYKLIVHFTPGVTVKVKENNRGIFSHLYLPLYERDPSRPDHQYVQRKWKSWVRSFFYQVESSDEFGADINAIMPEGHILAHDIERHFYTKREDLIAQDQPWNQDITEVDIMSESTVNNREYDVEITRHNKKKAIIYNPYNTAQEIGTANFTTEFQYFGKDIISTELWVLRICFDISIGFIPYVGDVVDIADFAYALYTGTDKWGDPVTSLDLALMGAGAALPFASSGLVKNAFKAVAGGL